MVRRVRIGGRRSKYNVRRDPTKRTVDGIVFASQAEARRYEVLKLRQRAGVIGNLSLQPRFILQEPFTCRGKKINGIRYTADFRYTEDGETVIEEVKGRETRDFELRKKMFLKLYGDRYRYKQVPSDDVLTHP